MSLTLDEMRFANQMWMKENCEMAIREFECAIHGRFERIDIGLKVLPKAICPVCGEDATYVEFSVPARRNPEHGLQR